MVVVLDPTLTEVVDVTEGLKDGGWLIVNSEKEPKEFAKDVLSVACVDATKIAIENGLGSKLAPIVNTAILGSVSKVTGVTKIESVKDAIMSMAPAKPEANAKAAEEASNSTTIGS